MFDKVTAKLVAKTPPEKIASEFKNDLIGVLTTAQFNDIIGRGLRCGSQLGNETIFDLLNRLGTVLNNNLLPFIRQLSMISQIYLDKGASLEKTEAVGFGKVNQFVTHKRIETIFCRFRVFYNMKQWRAIYSNFKTFFLFDLYPCCIPS